MSKEIKTKQPEWHEKVPEAVHDDKNIKGFFGEYRWMSNYHDCIVKYEGLSYDSSEAAYQAAKTLDKDARIPFTKMGANESKKAGEKLVLRENWEEIKLQVMEEILVDKFTNNPTLKWRLIETGDKFLEETNWWNDTYWGVCSGVGHNHLGKILMKIREKLKQTV